MLKLDARVQGLPPDLMFTFSKAWKIYSPSSERVCVRKFVNDYLNFAHVSLTPSLIFSDAGSPVNGEASSPPPAINDNRPSGDNLDTILFQLRQVTRERDELRKRLALASPGTTFDDCRCKKMALLPSCYYCYHFFSSDNSLIWLLSMKIFPVMIAGCF